MSLHCSQSSIMYNAKNIPFRSLSKSVLSSHMRALSDALKRYSKKTGAGSSKVSVLPENAKVPSAIGSLMQVTNGCSQTLRDVLPLVEQYGAKTAFPFIIMLAAQFERLMTNILRILNDRASMLYRKNIVAPLESSCNLHQDIILTSAACTKFVTVMSELCVLLNQAHTVSRIRAVQVIAIAKRIHSRVKHHTSKIFPHLQRRVEDHLTGRLSVRVTAIGEANLTRKSFRVSKGHQDVQLGAAIRDQILVPLLGCLKTYCTSHSSIERLFTASSNCCVMSMLAYIKENRLPFNELGVFVLHAQLDCLLQWVLVAKAELGYAPSNPIILDSVPWHKANSVMNILLATTGGAAKSSMEVVENSFGSIGKTKKVGRYLTIFEQERWAELGQSRKWTCVGNTFYSFFSTRKNTVVSISPILDIRDL